MNDHELVSLAAYDALLGKRDDVYPCREDIPAELWGQKIIPTPYTEHEPKLKG